MAKNKQMDNTADIFSLATQLQENMEAAVAKSQTQAIQTMSEPSQTASTTQTTSDIKKHLRSFAFKSVGLNPNSKSALVSIVIPVFNKVSYTIDCLESLSRQISKYNLEVIVIDNASTDQTPMLIGKIPGIKYIRNETNQGFVDGCNGGVKKAKGEVVVLLNNDTKVLGGWLDALVDRLLSDFSIGLVGSKIIYPDGSLQEAGGILFSDGSGHNFGKTGKPDNFEYNFCRDVDYCSGASIAFRRKDFNSLGGFDKRFAPAYYEDSDLAMSMHYKLNKRVVYEPHSVLMHIEGVTSGTDTTTGFKRYQTINHDKFLKKWAFELKKYHYTSATNTLVAARYGKRKKVLIVDSIVPEYNRDSGSLRMTQIIKSIISLGYDVTLYADNKVASQPYTGELQAIGVEVVYGAGLTERDFYRHRINMYDIVILSRPTTAIWHISYCKGYLPKARLLYDTVDLHYLRIRRQAVADKLPALMEESKKWQALEYYLMDRSDATLLVSYEEEKLLKKDKPGLDVFTVSNINPAPLTLKKGNFDNREGLLFMADYSRAPNYTAAQWFVKSVLPIIRKELPDIKLTLLGSNPAAIQDLASSNIVVTGFVEDKEPFYNEARVFICPLLYGAGVKGKVSESIAFGLPVVSTSIGTEGMHLENGVSCLEAEKPEAFAKQVIRLYNDKELWDKLNKNSRAVYEKYFSQEAGVKAIKSALTNK